MMTDHDLEAMAKTFRSEKKFNAMGGMGLKLLGEIELLRMQNRHAKIDGIKMAAEIASDFSTTCRCTRTSRATASWASST